MCVHVVILSDRLNTVTVWVNVLSSRYIFVTILFLKIMLYTHCSILIHRAYYGIEPLPFAKKFSNEDKTMHERHIKCIQLPPPWIQNFGNCARAIDTLIIRKLKGNLKLLLALALRDSLMLLRS